MLPLFPTDLMLLDSICKKLQDGSNISNRIKMRLKKCRRITNHPLDCSMQIHRLDTGKLAEGSKRLYGTHIHLLVISSQHQDPLKKMIGNNSELNWQFGDLG